MKIVLLLLILFLNVTKTYAVFQDFGRSVRAAGMGNTYIAIADDITAPVYNPAGVGLIENLETTVSYFRPYAGVPDISISNYLAAFGTSLFIHRVAVVYTNSVFYLSDIEYREVNHTLTTSLSVHRLVSLFYTKNKSSIPPVYLGVNVKLLTRDVFHQTIGRLNKSIFTYDVGVLTELLSRRVRIGSVVRNLPEQEYGIFTVEKVPGEYAVGISYNIGDWRFCENILLALDMTYRNQPWGNLGAKLKYSFGSEMWLAYHRVGLRTGINPQEITVGLSFMFKILTAIQIDYALIYPYVWNDTIVHHLVGLTFRF